MIILAQDKHFLESHLFPIRENRRTDRLLLERVEGNHEELVDSILFSSSAFLQNRKRKSRMKFRESIILKQNSVSS